jgi:hypothetical protein
VEKEPANDFSNLQERAARGSLEKFQSTMSKVSDAPPEGIDRL